MAGLRVGAGNCSRDFSLRDVESFSVWIAALREAQNYIRAYTRGLGIFELPEYLAWPDWDDWAPLTAWLRSQRSQP